MIKKFGYVISLVKQAKDVIKIIEITSRTFDFFLKEYEKEFGTLDAPKETE